MYSPAVPFHAHIGWTTHYCLALLPGGTLPLVSLFFFTLSLGIFLDILDNTFSECCTYYFCYNNYCLSSGCRKCAIFFYDLFHWYCLFFLNLENWFCISGPGNLHMRLWFPNCWGWSKVLSSQWQMVRLAFWSWLYINTNINANTNTIAKTNTITNTETYANTKQY